VTSASTIRRQGGAYLKRIAICSLWQVVSLTAAAQEAEISGLVTDSTHAVVPQASLRIVNQSTGTTRATQTSEAGIFMLRALQPGTYDLEISKEGFHLLSRLGIKLDVAAHIRLNFTLQVGGTTESITVTGRNDLSVTTESAVGGLITSSELARLPVDGRNYTRLILTLPGTSDRSKSQSNGTFSGTNLYSVNGQRPQDNSYTLDGVENNLFRMNSPGASPPMDSLEEFRVVTGASAEFGRSVGANVTVVTKSGSREVHGTVYEYLRNDKLDANEFFANRTGAGKVPLRQNQYGVSLGGPLVVPGASRRRERTFWFLSWEGFRLTQGSTLFSTVPVAAQRMGDFSQQARQIFDPNTSQPGPGGVIVRQPFAGNRIPAGRINPASRSVLELLLPLPNRPGLSTNFVNTESQKSDRGAWVARADHVLTPKDNLMVRYLNQSTGQASPQQNPNITGSSRFDVHNAAGSWTRQLSTSSMFELRLGYHQPYVSSVIRPSGLTRSEFLSNSGIRMFQQEARFNVTPVFLVTGQFGTNASGAATEDHVYQIMGGYSKLLGRHSLKAGIAYSRRLYFYNGSTPIHGTAAFDSRLTELATQANSGHGTASFLLGYPSQIDRGQGDPSTNGRQNATHLFLQDEWRLSARVTVNAGLRYELNNPPYDTTDRVGTLWLKRDAQSGRYSGELLWGAVNPLPDPTTGAVNQPPRRGPFGRTLQANSYRNFAPRLGIAYQLSGRTVIRSGFGIYYNSTFMQELQDKRKFYPYNISQTFVANTGVSPDLSITDSGPAYSNTTALGGWAQRPENRTPYSLQWNLFVVRELGFATVIEAGYAGSGNRRQIGYTPFNVAVSPGPGPVQPRRLLPEYGDLNWGANLHNSNYNALQVKALRRFSRGVQFQVNYTWSRSMDDQSSLAESKVQNPFDQRADYSRSSWDLRHVFQFAYVWEMPFGHQRRFGSDWPIGLDLMLGGWAIEGITRYQTGAPVNVLLGQDRANVGSTMQRPNVIRDPNTGPRTPERWFDTGAFQMPAPFTYGNAGAFIVDSDGRRNWDVSLAKQFQLSERGRLEARAELFNISNSVAMGDPNSQFSSPSFGQVSSATAARQIQVALRFRF
jgi:hypothetical protein